MLKTIFPDKQLLIRQNGDIKYITLPTWLQLALFSLGLAVCLIAGLGSYQYVSLNQQVIAQQHALEDKQSELDALHLSYREKHTALSQQLSQIDEKSQLMTNMLESLPEAQQIEFKNKTLANQQNTATTTEQAAQSGKPADNKALDEKQTKEQAPKQTSESTNSLIEETLIQENQNLDQQFELLNDLVETRTSQILKAIDKSGVDQSSLLTANAHQAQGGPFNAVNTDVLNDKQQALLDKIVALNELSNHLEQLPTGLPAKDFYVSSRYGLRTDPISKKRAMHRGIDMAGWHKTKIFAPASGVVKRAGRNGGFGNFIEIKHSNGFVTRYGHLAKIKVKRGQQVNKDQVIGLMGSSGRSTSTHLHYEILHNKKHINPLKLTKAFENVLQ